MSDLIEHLQAAGLNPLIIDEETFKPPSPFYPGTNLQFAWDATCIGYLKRCPRLYYYVMIEGWTLKDDNIHLRFGGEYHRALEEYDIIRAAGVKHKEAVMQTLHQLLIRIHDWDPDANTKSEQLKTKPNLVRAVLWYLEKFKDDTAKTVMLKDGKPAVELSFRFELDWGASDFPNQPYLLCGHLDRVVDYMEDNYVMDRKTSTTTLTGYYFNQWDPENQMTLYALAGKVILDSPVKGVIIDAVQIATAPKFGRHITQRTDAQLSEWVVDLQYWFRLAEHFASKNYWPMNDTACDKYGGCRFRNICSKSPQVRNVFLKSDFEKGEKWNPLIPR